MDIRAIGKLVEESDDFIRKSVEMFIEVNQDVPNDIVLAALLSSLTTALIVIAKTKGDFKIFKDNLDLAVEINRW